MMLPNIFKNFRQVAPGLRLDDYRGDEISQILAGNPFTHAPESLRHAQTQFLLFEGYAHLGPEGPGIS